MEDITDRQKEILTFIQRTSEERGFPPTIREIGEEMDIRSTNGGNDHLKALERKGFLTRGEQQSRSLVPTKRARMILGMGAKKSDPTMLEIPLLGRVAAGAPADSQLATRDHPSRRASFCPPDSAAGAGDSHPSPAPRDARHARIDRRGASLRARSAVRRAVGSGAEGP